MKIAIISDIKSNVYALEAVLKDIREKNIEIILNLGDSFYGPIEPKKTYELIKENKLINICGDQDRQILEATLDQLENDKLLNYIYNDLGEEVLYFIQDLGFEKLIGQDYYMVHGTYFDDSQSLLEEIKDKQINLRSDEEIIKLTDNIKSTFIFCGNSHLPRTHTLKSNQIAINPGSVGLQALEINNTLIENNTAAASYAIFTLEDNQYQVEHLRVEYEVQKAIGKALENGREDWAYALKEGKVLK